MDEGLVFKTTYWYHEEEDDSSIIHIAGRTSDNKSVHLIAENFTPFLYIELPTRVKWNQTKLNILFRWLKERLGHYAPIKMSGQRKKILHYSRPGIFMFLTFQSQTSVYKLSRMISYARGFAISGLGSFQPGEFKIHEANIDAVLKFTATRDIRLCDWIHVNCQPNSDEEKFTSADIDCRVDWSEINPYEGNIDLETETKYLSFDIECYSVNHNSKLPNPQIPENVIFQISMVFGYLNIPEKKRILLSLGKPKNIKNCDKLLTFENESDLLLMFTKLTRTEDPDIFIGYNIMKFDWQYMIERAKHQDILKPFLRLGRIKRRSVEIKKSNWSSGAYGEQSFEYPECHGRTNVDILVELERGWRLPKYSLNYVSQKFLRDQKDELSARELFMLYQITDEILPKVYEKKFSVRDLIKFKIRISEIIEPRKCQRIMRSYRKRLLSSTLETFCEMCQEAMEITGKYCIQDTILPIDLAEKLNTWTTMIEMSNVTNVPVSYLQTRGQQIKVLAQVFRETIKDGYVIPTIKDSGETKKYQGATVIEAIAGDYENVPSLDFASLYPTIMMAFNICYTTITQSKEHAHVLEWGDHVGCECDPKKRKKKKEEILCEEHRYYFKKTKYKFEENGEITRSDEGLMPRLLRRLLTTRKKVKKQMNETEALIKMNRGDATPYDINSFKQKGWEIIEKDKYSKEEEFKMVLKKNILDARQKALKVSANSMYGAMGVARGKLPLRPGAASVTAMGRKLIMMAIRKVEETFDFAKLVYGDTDSCMFHFDNKNVKEVFKLATDVSKMVTNYLKCYIIGVDENYCINGKHIKDWSSSDADFSNLDYKDKCLIIDYQICPIDLEFEDLYGRFLLLTKKRYICEVINDKNEVISKTKKGVITVRRDNCDYARHVHNKIVDLIMKKADEKEVMNLLYDQVHRLFTRDVKDTDLLIYTGVRSVIDYAISREYQDDRGTKIKIPTDEYGAEIEDPCGPLDTRLRYPNYPQVLLSLKMLRRGEQIPPNTRLEYLYLEVPDATHQGERAEDYIYYDQHKNIYGYKIDYLHYLEKNLTNPIMELLNVKYPKPCFPYYTYEEIFKEYMLKFNDLHRFRISNASSYKKIRENLPKCKTLVGWKTLKTKGEHHLADDKDFLMYSYKGKEGKDEAKITFIIDQIKYGKDLNDISKNSYEGLFDFCTRWKSMFVINKIYKKHGMKKRRLKSPQSVGNKLRENTEVMIMKDLENVKSGRLAKIIKRYDIETEEEGVIYKYDLMTDDRDEIILKDLPRKAFRLYMKKDSTVMKDIHMYRLNYKKVIEHINQIRKELTFIIK